MGEYEIGRDVHQLRSRVERFEAILGENGIVCETPETGVAACHQTFSGVGTHGAPIDWKPDKREQTPPLLYSLLDIPLTTGLQFDIRSQSTTWGWAPEPLVLFVTWDGGGSDEFYRLQNQTFTKSRWTTPDTGAAHAVATYAATLVASGKGQDHPNNPPNAALRFNIVLRNANGGPLFAFDRVFRVRCRDNYTFYCSSSFDPGLYDLVSGATGFIDDWHNNYRVGRC